MIAQSRLASRERYLVTSETRKMERSAPYADRELALATAADVAEQMRLGRSEVLWIAVDDYGVGAGERIFYAEKKVGQ